MTSSRFRMRPGRRSAPACTPEYILKWESIVLLIVIPGCILWSTHAAWDTWGWQLAIAMGCGLLLGVVATKQRGRMCLVSDILVVGLGFLEVWWLVTITFMHGRPFELAQSLATWSGLPVVGQVEVTLPWFYFAILMLAIGFADMHVWCVRWPRWLWFMHVMDTLVLLYFLYPHWDQNIPLCLLFMLASLLLSVHVHLDISIEDWIRAEIPYPAHLRKVMTRLGALTIVIVLLLAWFLPAGYINSGAATLWNRAQAGLRTFISGQQGALSLVAYPFSDSLSLTGTPRLSPQVVATVQSPQNVYLEARWYDTYTGEDWVNGETRMQDYRPSEALPSATLMRYPLQQTITMMTSQEEGYLLGAPGINAMSLPATVLTYAWDDEPVAWFARQEAVAAGTQYQVISSVSDADAQSLRSVGQSIGEGQSLFEYDQLFPFLQIPDNIDARVTRLAAQITAGIPDMYDKAVALETYLRTHYTYNLHVQLPPGREAVSWFLFDSGNQGYCVFFASAMTILARLIGLPARLVTGYAPGSYESKTGQQIIRGTDAHSWTQVYFGKYGWINFEPTSSFPTFNHHLPTLASPQSPGRRNVTGASGSIVPAVLRSALTAILSILTAFTLLLCLLCLLALQRLQPRGRAAELYRAVCLLARWAGCRPSSSQTPYEYMQRLLFVLPQAKEPLERLCDLYVRERWAHPASAEHPRSTGELQEVAGLWMQLRPQLVKAILCHRACTFFFKRA